MGSAEVYCVQFLHVNCSIGNYNDFRQLRTGSLGGLATPFNARTQTSLSWAVYLANVYIAMTAE